MATQRCLFETLGALVIVFFALAVTVPTTSAAAPPPPVVNTNHTVGDKAGWFYNISSNAVSGNYSDWAASQTFYLGDYLIFNTNTNSSIVQTNNETTYTLCDASNDDGNQTFLWGSDGGDSNSSTPTPQVVEIALIYEGFNYFFSDTMDGLQCQKGLKFGIKVLHGNGLPPSLNQPPPPPTSATPPAPATVTEGGGNTTSENQSSGKNGVEVIRGGMVWAGLGMLSLVLLAL